MAGETTAAVALESGMETRQGDAVNVTVNVTVDADAGAAEDAAEEGAEMGGTADMAGKAGKAAGVRRPAAPGPLFRSFDMKVDREALATRAAGSADDSIPIAISSESPVERYDWWEGERYLEVLDHSPECVDMSRCREGMPFLLNHSTNQQIGLVEGVRCDSDRVLRGNVRFSKAQGAQEIRQDMLDGIRKNISVGYTPDMNNVVRTQGPNDAIATERVKRWTPMEASSVPIPADITVGVGRSAARDPAFLAEVVAGLKDVFANRSAGGAAPPVQDDSPAPTAPREAKEDTVDPKDTAAQGGAATITAGEDRAAEQQRAARIRGICQLHGIEDRAAGFITAGLEPEDVGRWITTEAQKNLRAMSAPAGNLTEKEVRAFSLSRAVMGQVPGSGVDDSYEREVDAELRKGLPADYKHRGGIMVPTRYPRPMEQRTITSAATGAVGSSLIFTQPGEFIDLLRPKITVIKLGAKLLTGLQGNIMFPTQTAAGTWTWTGDVGAVTDTDMTLSQVALNPHVGQSTTGYSRLLLAQGASGNTDVDALVQDDLLQVAALGIDYAAIAGPNSGNGPRGILNTPGVGSLADSGGNGSVPTYADAVALETKVATANADIGTMAYLTTPGVRGLLKVSQLFPLSAAGIPVWQDGELNGYRAEVSTQVPSTASVGTASGRCHALIFGVWGTLIIGYWGAYEMVVDPYSRKKEGIIEITNFQIAGVALRYPAAFAAKKDCKLS